ncbi:MAG: cation diffusion facilitator family transporter [Xanthomonadaceae bacterium]|nr:cation diffusion facilitator family transporter [Xanthomonadaceae bacterium]MDE1884566.1 cation diffusion facilitator family transporter [Xanthomonadaceae bacterium]MDE1960830.1 cation diffusion facilitator family transporter [Xanthomonadaceae bacterium]MDE2084470.1 cation diffusion facilitator family transporter [Xanthomonadaceae bacterium]
MSGKADSVRTIFLALGANFAIFVAKLVAALVTGSGSMLAEAVHSLADCGNQVLLLIGMHQARRAPSPDHPLGYGMVVYFWSFLVALLLFSVGGVFSIYEGLHKLETHEPLRWPWLAVGVLVFGLAAEAFSMWGCLREVNKARGNRSLWRWFRDSRQSELIVVFGEDLAALLGLAFALAAVLATLLTGDPAFDAAGSIAIGALLCVVAVFVAREVASLLVGQSAEPVLHAALTEFVRAQPEVERVFNLITLQLGPDVMVATKAQMRGELSGDGLIAAINRVEAVMKARFPEIRWSFFEPDVAD